MGRDGGEGELRERSEGTSGCIEHPSWTPPGVRDADFSSCFLLCAARAGGPKATGAAKAAGAAPVPPPMCSGLTRGSREHHQASGQMAPKSPGT